MTHKLLGYSDKDNERFCGDGVVYFGRKNKSFKNDIQFHKKDGEFSRRQLQIRTIDDEYYAVDISASYPSCITLGDQPIALRKGMCLMIGDWNIFEVNEIYPAQPYGLSFMEAGNKIRVLEAVPEQEYEQG